MGGLLSSLCSSFLMLVEFLTLLLTFLLTRLFSFCERRLGWREKERGGQVA